MVLDIAKTCSDPALGAIITVFKRIVDIIQKAHDGEIDVPRKICKALWLVTGKKKEIFDKEIWPVEDTGT